MRLSEVRRRPQGSIDPLSSVRRDETKAGNRVGVRAHLRLQIGLPGARQGRSRLSRAPSRRHCRVTFESRSIPPVLFLPATVLPIPPTGNLSKPPPFQSTMKISPSRLHVPVPNSATFPLLLQRAVESLNKS